MDPWLKQLLIDNGSMTETGITRAAKPRRCKQCNQPIIVGLNDDQCAFETHADPQPLSALGEAIALLEGRTTIALANEGGRWVLHRRDDFQIRGRPAGTTPRWDVLRTHTCGTPTPTGPTAAPSTHPSTTRERLPANAPPPF